MNTDYKTMIILLTTPNKSKTYEELKTSVRHLLGSVYENKDTKKDIEKADSTTPINCMAYDRQLGSEEKEAINTMCNKNGIVVMFIEGTETAFDKIDNNTIILKENKED